MESECCVAMTDTVSIDAETVPTVVSRRPSRASANNAMAKIQETLEWEACDETSEQFQLVAGQFEEDFEEEALDSDLSQGDEYECEELSFSADSQSSYESSFVTDDSDNDSDMDNELDWHPSKRPCAEKKKTIAASSEHSKRDDMETEIAELIVGGMPWRDARLRVESSYNVDDKVDDKVDDNALEHVAGDAAADVLIVLDVHDTETKTPDTQARAAAADEPVVEEAIDKYNSWLSETDYVHGLLH